MLSSGDSLAIYLEGHLGEDTAKMGYGLLRYSPHRIACIIDSRHAGKKVSEVIETPRDCPVVGTISEAVALGATAFVPGIAPPGGRIPEAWWAGLDEAVERGMSLVNGLHDEMAPRYPRLHPGQWVWDMRKEPEGLGTGRGLAAALTNRRLLMVGTDMAVGKMTAGLEIHREAMMRGISSAFVATGQIGITICGRGVPLDAIRVDFASGAIEREVMAAKDADVVIVEGQGAINHPGSTSTLPLLRGSMPTHLILCHRAGQTHLRRLPELPIPPLAELVRLYSEIGSACGVFPRPVVAGVALNTAHIENPEAARAAADEIEQLLGIPCDDPVRHGAARLVDAVLTGETLPVSSADALRN